MAHMEEEHDKFYGVSSELVKSITEHLTLNNFDQIEAKAKILHAADIAEIIEKISPEHRKTLVDILLTDFNAEIISYLGDSVKEEIIELIGPKKLASILQGLESDDALSIIEDLDQDVQLEVLQATSAENRAILEEVLTYPEDSAGRLMQNEVVAVPSFWTVSDVMHYISTSKEIPDSFYDIFVVNPKHNPIGSVSLCKIIKEEKSKTIEQVMHNKIHLVPVSMDKEDVARLFQHYGLVSVPVVDPGNRLVGMITVDDVVDVIEEEATEDILHLAGISESDFYATSILTFLVRFRWLFVTLINTVLAAVVISQFQDTIKELVALAVLMPIATAMGGNSGMQVVTVTVRALATGDLRYGNITKSIGKEIYIGFLNGFAFALILGIASALVFSNIGLSLVLSAALLFNMVWASVAGILTPILIDKMGMDPALSAGPFLTTTTDVFGFAVFLGLAKMFLI